MFTKKGISAVIATITLVIVAFVAVVTFHLWFNDYFSETLSNVETQTSSQIEGLQVEIVEVIEDTIYIRNNVSDNFSDYTLSVDGSTCDIGNLSSGVSGYDISSCLGSISGSKVNFALVSSKGVSERTKFIRN